MRSYCINCLWFCKRLLKERFWNKIERGDLYFCFQSKLLFRLFKAFFLKLYLKFVKKIKRISMKPFACSFVKDHLKILFKRITLPKRLLLLSEQIVSVFFKDLTKNVKNNLWKHSDKNIWFRSVYKTILKQMRAVILLSEQIISVSLKL